MRLQQYGISLNRLREEDLELVRHWRNSQRVRDNMFFREYISTGQQLEWFKKIDNYDNFFYIIEYKGEKIGLIDNKNTNWSSGSTESGLFIYDEKYANSFIPVAASFILISVGFYILNGKDALIKVIKSNSRAIEYNTKLGFMAVDATVGSEDDALYFKLSRESFESKTKSLRQAMINTYAGNDPYLYLLLDADDYMNGVRQEVEKVIERLPDTLIKSITEKEDTKVICFDLSSVLS